MITYAEFTMKTYIQTACALALVILSALTGEAGAAPKGPDTELDLQSDYLPLPIRLKGDQSNRENRSIRIVGKVPPEGDGAGEIWLDSERAELNAFGDVVPRVGSAPAPMRVQLRSVAKGAGQTTNHSLPPQDSQASQGFRLYDVVFQGDVLIGGLKLVLGTATLGPHRLLAYGTMPSKEQKSAAVLGHIISLHGDPLITSVLPDAPLGREIDLSGYYAAADGRIHFVGVRGALGGAGRLSLDPNYITFDSFGEPVMSTAMGYQDLEITLRPAEGDDPLGQGRSRYWAIPKNLRNTNRVAVVLGRTETGPHRLLLYRDDQVTFIVPAQLSNRRRQEIVAPELAGLSTGEQQAIADLRKTTGHGFLWQIEKGHVVSLNFTDSTGRVPPEGVFARLPQLQSVQFSGGKFPTTGLADLGRLPQLRTLMFSGTEFQADGLATLKDLGRLESLTFNDCRGITDEGVAHLAGLTGLKTLGLYSERLLRRPPEAGPCVTDAGVAHLKRLIRLEHLDLFGHNVSDASVGILAAMTDLQTLALSGHGLTDAGLDGLARLLKLRELRLFETAVTTNGIAKVKARFPELQIAVWDRDGHD